MKIEDCKKGVKVRWEFDGETQDGRLVYASNSGSAFVVFEEKEGIYRVHLSKLTPIETEDKVQTKERTYTKEEIIEYMKHIGYTFVDENIRWIEDYFSAKYEEELKAIQLLKERGYNVSK